jgi:hypothetical protein
MLLHQSDGLSHPIMGKDVGGVNAGPFFPHPNLPSPEGKGLSPPSVSSPRGSELG